MQTCIKQPCWSHFPTTFARIVSLCYIVVILTIFQTLSLFLICYDDLSTVILDVAIVIVFECHELCPYKTVKLIEKRMCLDCSTNSLLPRFSPSPWASIVPEM